MTLKSLLFGSAAILAAGTGAQAADLPIAEPVEYVRICDAFGAGFYYIPGTDTCLKVGGQVRVEAHYVDTLDGNGDLLDGDDPDLNNFTTRARGNVRLDARTQTDFGLVRAFIDLELTVGPGGITESSITVFDDDGSTSSGGNANYSGTGASLAAAFVQISNDMGTFTAGHTGSFFDFFGSFAFGTRLDIDDNTTEQTLFAYTFSGGNGFSGTLSLEDPASSGRRLDPGFGFVIPDDPTTPAFDPIAVANDYEGQESPDLVANVRIDQGWGAAQIMGVVGQIHDNDDPFFDEDGDDEDEIGWAVGGGLSTTVPILGGLEFATQAGYSEGRLGYITTDRGDFGDFIDGPEDGDLEANTAWMVRAGVRASFTETVDASVSGSFTHVEAGDGDFDGDGEDDTDDLEYDFWAVNANVRWKPVEGLFMGPEVAYQTIDRSSFPGDEDEDDNDVAGVMFRVQRSF